MSGGDDLRKLLAFAVRKRCLNDQRGQMSVELAVYLPVLLLLALIGFNLLSYLGDCARFDRVSSEAVRTQAVSPVQGSYGTGARVQAVQVTIEAAFAGSEHLSIQVTAGDSGPSSDAASSSQPGLDLSLLARTQTYTCTLSYTPQLMPRQFFGITLPVLTHQRVYVIDPYRPGVLW